jgi:hypothetical protein
MDFRRMLIFPVLAMILALPVAAGNNGTSLKGSASLDRNRPVVGASVRIRPENDRSRYLLTSTDGQGLLETMDLPDGDYQVSLTKDGLAPVMKSAVNVRFPFRPVVEVKMGPGPDSEPAPAAVDSEDPLDLTGRVLTREGDPVADVTVRLVRLDGAGDPVKIRSAEDGTLTGSDLAPGSWAVEVRAAGFLSIRSTLDLEGPVLLVALLIPQPASYLAPAMDLLPDEQPVPPAGATPLP